MPYPSSTLFPASDVLPGPAFQVAQGRPREDWLAGELFYVDGSSIRFGPDEADARAILQAWTHDTQIPGGYGNASGVLPRPPNLRADDAKLYSHFRAYGAGNRTAYEGRVTGVPQVGEEIRLEFEGWSAHLDDDETFAEIYADRNLSRWGPMSAARELAVRTAGNDLAGNNEVLPGGVLSVKFDRLASPPQNINELWYDAGNIPLGFMWLGFTNAGGIGVGDTNWDFYGFFTSSDNPGAMDIGADFNGGSGAVFVSATTADRVFAGIESAYHGTFTGDGSWVAHWAVVIYGRHGLVGYGAVPGFRASDIIANAVSRAAPMLNFTLGDSIESSDYVVPHFVALEPATVRQGVIEPITALGGSQLVPNDWGVYDDREFFHRSPGTYGRTWRVRRDQVASPTSSGPQAEQRCIGMKISYRDGAGKAFSVGPPGSGSNFETPDLLDKNPDNPALKLQRKFRHRQVGITDQTGAVNIGKMLMAEANALNWEGTVDIRGEAIDDAGNRYPARDIKSGDRFVVEDDEGLWEPLPVYKTSYAHDDLHNRVDIGAPPKSGEVLLSRLAAATDLVAT